MIIGIGIDFIEVERIKKLAEKSPRFVQRIFTPQEIKYSGGKANMYQHLAARFAAKEAFFKALGRRIKWTDVGVVNLPSGQPRLEVKEKDRYPFTEVHLSIAHLAEYAIAFVILESDA